MKNLSKVDIKDIYDERGKRIVNTITEDIALSEELRYRAPGVRINMYGEKIHDEGQLWGFDPETATYSKMLSYATDPRIKKRSTALKMLVLRKIAVRFPDEMSRDKTKIANTFRVSLEEIELIQSNAKNDAAWFGEVGFHGKQYYDRPLRS